MKKKKSSVKDVKNIKNKIIQLVNSKENGISQKELWKVLKIDSKRGTKILLRLIKEGKIYRFKTRINGKLVYVLKIPKRLVILPIELVSDIVCFPCSDMNICSEEKPLNPITCQKLSKWLQS